MTDKDHRRLMRRRWLEKFLYKKLWFKHKSAMKLSRLMP